MRIGGEGISKYSCEYGVGKKNFKKTPFHVSSLGNGLNKF
jgi:hypothetical protein